MAPRKKNKTGKWVSTGVQVTVNVRSKETGKVKAVKKTVYRNSLTMKTGVKSVVSDKHNNKHVRYTPVA